MNGKSRRWSSPYYARKKQHKCLKCSSVLRLVTSEHMVYAGSAEAKRHDYECDMLVVEDIFKCDNCGFQADPNGYKLIDKRLSAMEKSDHYSKDEKAYNYIYDDYLVDAFKRRLFCKSCNRKIKPAYRQADKLTLSKSDITFTSFNKEKYEVDNDELRALYFVCPRCDLTFELNEVEVNDKLKANTPLTKLINILIPILFFLLFFRFCGQA